MEPSHYEPAGARDRAKVYRVVGLVMLALLVLIAIFALLGAKGPGLFTDRSAFFGLGVSVLLLAIVLAWILFTFAGMVTSARRQRMEVERLLNELRAQTSGITRRAATISPRTAPTATADEPIPPPRPAAPAPSSPSGPRSLRAAKTPHARMVRGQPVIDIEGIGEKLSKRLNEQNIRSIGDLRAADPDAVASAISQHPTTVRQWQAMGDLMELHGIGKQFAELLVRTKIMGVRELAGLEPEALLPRINETNASRETRIQGAPVGLENCRNWIQAANEALA